MNTSPAKISLTEPDEFFAYVLYRLGFWPENSLSIVGVRGRPATDLRHRSDRHVDQPMVGTLDLIARVDLADLDDDLARQDTLTHFSNRGCTGVFVALDASGYPWSAIPELMQRTQPWFDELVSAGIEVHLIAVCAQGIIRELDFAYGCWRVSSQSYPVDAIASTVIAATMVAEGISPVSHRRDLRMADYDSTAKTFTVAAAHDWDAVSKRWYEVIAQAEVLTDTFELNEEQVELFVSAASLGKVRDRMMLSVFADIDLSGDVKIFMQAVLTPGGPKPSARRTIAILTILDRLIQQSNAGQASVLYAMAGWLYWLNGQGAQADVVSSQALELDLDQPLATLTMRALKAQMSPGWAQSDDWHPAAS